MSKVSAAKELMEAAAVMGIIATVGSFFSLTLWVWVAILFWAEMPMPEVLAWTWAAIWTLGMAYCVLGLIEREGGYAPI